MFARLVILFVTVPLIELYLLFRINDWTGSAITTIGLVLLTGFLGAWFAKQQGLSTIMKIQLALVEGRLPSQELLDGAMILVAAALLLTPGLLTDVFGFSLLLPPCRHFYRKFIKLAPVNVQFHSFSEHPSDYDDQSVVEGSVRSSVDDQSSRAS